MRGARRRERLDAAKAVDEGGLHSVRAEVKAGGWRGVSVVIDFTPAKTEAEQDQGDSA